MTVVGIVMVALGIMRFVATWHGERMFQRGIRHGRSRERTDARLARSSIVLQAETCMLEASRNELDIEAMLDKDELDEQRRVESHVKDLIEGSRREPG